MVRPGRDKLAGAVAWMKTYVGGERPAKHGRGAEGKTLVLIAAQHDGAGIGRIRLCRISDLSGTAVGGGRTNDGSGG